MTRHVIDHPRTPGARLVPFARIERMRGQKARPQVEVLRRAPRKTAAGIRLQRFLEIERTRS